MKTNAEKLTGYIYIGKWDVRRSFVEFFRFLFEKLDFTEEYRWSNNDSKTKIWINAAYPNDAIYYPRVIVESTPMIVECTGFRDLSDSSDITGEYWFSGKHEYSVTVKIRDYLPDPVEKITSMILVMLSCSEIRNCYTVRYGTVINIPKSISSTISEFTIPDTNKVGYESTFRLTVNSQWEAVLPGVDIQTIESEAVQTIKIE